MKICIIGYFQQNTDEGIRNVTSHIARELSKNHEIIKIDINHFFSQLSEIQHFKPQILHIFSGPSSILIFILLKMLTLKFKSSKVILSALQLGDIRFSFIVPFLRPNLVLVQSSNSNQFFINHGCKTEILFNGVDTQKFYPAESEIQKESLKNKYGIPANKFVILHVGHIRKNRNVTLLQKLQKGNNQVLIVGSQYTPYEKEIYNNLIHSGCLVLNEFIPKIEELYLLADCYVFPTIDKFSCIETPLSVLEAMSCNLPIITTKFGSLQEMFDQESGFFFFENENELDGIIYQIKTTKNSVKTRESVEIFSWENILQKLERTYNEILH